MRDSLIFVYGTLRRGSTHHHLIAAVGDYLMQGSVAGNLYDIGTYPGLVVNPTTTYKVTGEVYRMADSDGALNALDDYEGCSANFAPPFEFIRQTAEVMLEDGKIISAWVYLYNGPVKNKPEILLGDYLHDVAKRT